MTLDVFPFIDGNIAYGDRGRPTSVEAEMREEGVEMQKQVCDDLEREGMKKRRTGGDHQNRFGNLVG